MKAITGESGRFATRAFDETEIGHVPVGRSDDDGLLEVIFCPKKLGLELVDIGLALLNVESAAGVGRLQLGHLREP